MRTAESGNALTFHFCPTCGSTVYWESEGFPGYVAVAIGNFAPEIPRTDHRGVGGVAPPLGLVAARHAAQTRCEARVMNAAPHVGFRPSTRPLRVVNCR
jgi:hypothetical protein